MKSLNGIVDKILKLTAMKAWTFQSSPRGNLGQFYKFTFSLEGKCVGGGFP